MFLNFKFTAGQRASERGRRRAKGHWVRGLAAALVTAAIHLLVQAIVGGLWR
jgi:hypothetical protein